MPSAHPSLSPLSGEGNKGEERSTSVLFSSWVTRILPLFFLRLLQSLISCFGNSFSIFILPLRPYLNMNDFVILALTGTERLSG